MEDCEGTCRNLLKNLTGIPSSHLGTSSRGSTNSTKRPDRTPETGGEALFTGEHSKKDYLVTQRGTPILPEAHEKAV